MPQSSRPLISVVIPSYNHGRFVAATIKSVLDQSLQDFEIVITDDGSTDNTVNVIRQFTDSRIRLNVFPENRGASVAANDAIQRSQGEIICHLSSDDLFLPGKLERQVSFLASHADVAAAFGLPRVIDEQGVDLKEPDIYEQAFRLPLTINLQGRKDWLRHFFFHQNCLCHPSAMVRRAVYDKIGPFDARLVNLPDFDMWIRLCGEFEIRVLPEQLVAARILDNAGNVSAPRRDSVLRTQIEHFEILKRYLTLGRAEILEIFAPDLAKIAVAPNTLPEVMLAQLALLGDLPAHKLFAVDVMFQNASTTEEIARLLTLTGSIDVFNNDMVFRYYEMRSRLGQAQTTIERLQQELGNALSEVARLRASQSLANSR
jgi:glycosyltransferase involved in cell wall biosynthesis